MAATTTDLATALNAAIQGGYVTHLTGQTYTISSPIVIHVTSTIQGALGIDGGGATFVSQVTDGSPLITIVVDPGVDFRYLTLSNFTIEGNGREGDGIRLVADGNDRWLYNWNIDHVTVENTGGYGLDVRGSVFEGLVSDSWMNGNALGGAVFAHSGGGQASALRWFGGGFKDNGGAGLTLDNGARDISVDDALFLNNHGVGISAGSGITAVTGSHFQDNQGPGIWFQNYGNFSGNSFASSGAQSVGISGYLAGGATLVDNISSYTGAGADTLVLANLQGNGNAFLSGDHGPIVTGTGIAQNGPADGASAQVLVIPGGVALPTLPVVTAAITAPLPSSMGTGALETALRAAMASGQVAHLTDVTYTVAAPIVINLTSSAHGPVGIDLGGAKILSQITDGSPVIQINLGPGVDLAGLTLSNFSILGNGLEGDGLKIVANGPDRRIHDWTIENVNVEHVGGIGLDILGNVAHGTVINSWMHGNGLAGARFADSTGGGVVSDVDWVGGGFRKNGGVGLVLDSGVHEATVKGAYFVENGGPGLFARSGVTLVEDSGFENNGGAGAIVLGPANFSNDSFSTYGPQAVGVAGSLAGGQISLTGLGIEYYGAGSDPTMLANVQGNGSVAVTGVGKVVVGPGVAVEGGQPYSPPPPDTTAPAILSIAASGMGIGAGSGDLAAGKTVTFTMTLDETVTVTGGTPTLLLNDGGIASWLGGSGGSVLTFAHTVQPGQNAADLAILSISLNGAVLEDAAGNAADLSTVTNYNPAGTLQIDTTAPTVSSIAASVAGSGSVNAILGSGAVVRLTVAFSEPVTVSGSPTLTLNDGGVATLVGGSGTSTLLFSHTVLAGQNTPDLAVSNLTLNGGAIVDGAGNSANVTGAVGYNPNGILKIDTTAHVAVAAQSTALPEGNLAATSFSFTVTLSAAPASSETVRWAVAGSGATQASAADFAGGVLPSGVLTIAAGETSKSIVVSVLGDTVPEPSEGFVLTLSSPTSGLTIDTASATGTIVNDDASVSVAALSAMKAEGNGGSTAFTFVATRTGDTTVSHTVSYGVAGSGTNPADATDFTGGVLPGGTLTFAPGETNKTISVSVAGDTAVEASEGFTLSLSNPSAGLTIATASATGTIQNDDASVSAAALSAVKAEGNVGSTAFTFVATRAGDTTVSQVVSYAVAGSGASPADASDFAGGVLPGGTLTFAAGETSKTIPVNVAGDSVVEANEGFTLSLSNPSSGLTIATASATGTIQNDDASVSVAALSAVKAEGNGGSTAFTFVATRTGDTTVSQVVSYAVAGSGASPADATDFAGGVLPGGTLTFAAGETSKTIPVNVAGDSVVEANEGFTLSLSNPSSGLTIATASATGTIQNDDASVSVAALSAVKAEGNVGSTAFTFVATRAGDTTVPQVVSYAVAGSGASPADASDFAGGVLPGGTLTFAAGETSKTISVIVAADAVVEANEGFIVSLSSPSAGLTISTASATGTIQNDDIAPPVAAHDDAYIVLQGQLLAATAGVLLNDQNASTATPLGAPAHGTLNFSAGGTFSYIPTPGYFGLDSFPYHAGDGSSGAEAQTLLYVIPVSSGTTTTLNLTALSVEQLVASTYVAFFGRAADAGGFDFWVDQFTSAMSKQSAAGSFTNIASSFGVSDEAKGLYPFLAHPFGASNSEIGSFLDSLYNNLFNRSVDAAGLAYWTNQVRQTLAAGEFVGSVLIQVIGGAQNTGTAQDLTTLMAKVAVSLHYVHEQERHGTPWSGPGDVAAATVLVETVTADPQSLLVGLRHADALIDAHT